MNSATATKNRKPLAKPRSIAFFNQAGRCFYCDQPMWIGNNVREFASRHNITVSQARRFQCTGEHLKAHHEGGSAKPENIVAACLFCNRKRHARQKEIPSPEQYRRLIQQRMDKGRWHQVRLHLDSLSKKMD